MDFDWRKPWDEADARVQALKDERVRTVFGRFVRHLREGDTLLRELRYTAKTRVDEETPGETLSFFLEIELYDALRYVCQESLRCIPHPDGRPSPEGDLGEAQSESEMLARYALVAEMAARDPRVPVESRERVLRNVTDLRCWLGLLWARMAEVREVPRLVPIPEDAAPPGPGLRLRGEHWRPVLLDVVLDDVAPERRDEARAVLAGSLAGFYERVGVPAPAWVREQAVAR